MRLRGGPGLLVLGLVGSAALVGSVLAFRLTNGPDTPWAWLAGGLGLGWLPWIGATAGALPGLLIGRMMSAWPPVFRGVGVTALVLVAVPVCAQGVRGGPLSDPVWVVADELLTLPVAVSFLPSRKDPGGLVVAFVLSRVADGIKPPPAAWIEGLGGASGMVLDDVVANLWTLALMLAVYRWWLGGRKLRS